MSATNDEPNAILDADGNGYVVMQWSAFHKRAHLWRVENHNHFHSIATFNSDDEALAFLRWMRLDKRIAATT